MKSFGRSWRGLLAAWVLLAPTATALADDPGVARARLIGSDGVGPNPPRPPRVLSPGAPIPANGGILIESIDGVAVTAAVTSPTGTRVEGTTTLLSMPDAAYFAWAPAAELGLGEYWVELRNESGSSLDSTSSVEIAAAADRAKPMLAISPSVSTLTAPSERACCLTLSQDGLDHCALTEQQTFAQVDLGLSSTETVSKLNQFLFRVRVAEGNAPPNAPAAFRPFGASAALNFEAAADEYCLEVDALDIVTLEEHRYPDLDHCVAGSSVRVGTTPVELDDEFLAGDLCVRPPVGHEERWCEVNAGACANGRTQKCAQLQDTCEDEPRPDAAAPEADAGLDDEHDASADGGNERESDRGCTVAARGARSSSGAAAYLVLVMLGLATRRVRRMCLYK